MTGNTTPSPDDPRAFWEARYPAWDLNRHGIDEKALPLIYRLTRNPPEAIIFRKQVAIEHIKEHFQGKHIIELGCGTGRAGPEIVSSGAASYHGIDFASTAIDIAKENAVKIGMADAVNYSCKELLELDTLEADLVFSSGFISWLTDEQIRHMFSISKHAHYLHTITEPRLDLRQIVKNIYLGLTKSDPFKVRYFTVDDIRTYLNDEQKEVLQVLRHKKLYTLAYISSLPYPENLKQK